MLTSSSNPSAAAKQPSPPASTPTHQAKQRLPASSSMTITSTATSATNLRRFTAAEVQAESTLDKPLFIFRQQVYDLTEFVETHPGGDILLDFHGQDVTNVMDDPVHHAHSEAAYDMLGDFLVGTVLADTHDDNDRQHLQPEKPSTIRKRPAAANLQPILVVDQGEADNGHEAAENDRPKLSPKLDTPYGQVSKSPRDDFIDLKKPVMWQLWSYPGLTREVYLQEVHKPRHMKDPARLFANPILELCSRTPWYVVPMVWLPVNAYLFRWNWDAMGLPVASSLFATGLLYWTLLEYVLHRFVFHLDESVPDFRVGIMLHFLLHGIHHYLPMDRLRLVFPPVLAVIIISIHASLWSALVNADVNAGIHAGGLTGYVLYDLTHYHLHHARPILEHFRTMKTYHMDHHYKQYNRGYGITSKFWDRIFDTVLE